MKKYGKVLASIALIFVILIFLFVGYRNSDKQEDSSQVLIESSQQGKKEIKAYIVGEVKKPGVYSLTEGDRVENIINKAGGFTETADTASINLAQLVSDQMKIIVNKKGTAVSISSSQNSDGKISINQADKEQLKKVPGIGDVTAQKIIDYREKNGGFKNIDELKKIDRIGDKTYNKIKDYFILW
ncbi:MAG: helix-hairpin-helix domain-containing protein [Bacillota bacterium]|nr:helix-hairpin-helix domain-containing protein [Bacillota bacterium]